VIVAVVLAGRPSATTRSNSSSPRNASIALPDAVEYAVPVSPIREAIWMGDAPATLST
jgi:hypothetical protein